MNVSTRKGLPQVQTEDQIKQVVAKVQEEAQNFRHPGTSSVGFRQNMEGAKNTEEEDTKAAFEAFNLPLGSFENINRTSSRREQGPVQLRSRVDYVPRMQDSFEEADAHEGYDKHDGELFVKYCDREGCNFVTMKSRNPAAINGILKELEFHIRDRHSNDGARMVDQDSAGRRAFIEATRQTIVHEGVDNRSSILHEVRLRPGILDYKMGARMTPIVQTACYCYPDFSHLDVRVMNGKTMQWLHDRSCQCLRLQMFSKTNLSAREIEAGGRGNPAEENSLKALENVGDAVIAVDNYSVCYSWIHPACYAAKALQRLVLRKFASNNIRSVKQVDKFFVDVTCENACRATRKELPLTYDELLAKWDREWPPVAHVVREQASQHSALAANLSQLHKEFKDFRNQTQKRNSSPSGGVSSGTVNLGKKFLKKWKKGASGYCPDFNTVQGCSNPPSQSGAGCIKDSVEMKHACSLWINGRGYCNSSEHNRQNHV